MRIEIKNDDSNKTVGRFVKSVLNKKAPGLSPGALLYSLKDTYLRSFLPKSTITGVATHIDEYVPKHTPINNANEKPRITSPPKMNNTTNTNITVNAVIMVRLKVLLIAWLITSLGLSVFEWCRLRNSRIRSNTTTVSLIE